MARHFNGTTDDYENNAFNAGTGRPITVMCWARAAGTFGTPFGIAGTNSQCSITFNNSGGNHYEAQTFSGGFVGPNTITVNTWFHIAITIDGSGNGIIYYNGVSAGTGATAVTGSANTKVSAGAQTGIGQFFPGDVQDCAIFTTVLTAGEILGIANGRRPYELAGRGLLLYWPLDGLVSPEPDLSGNKANVVTINGSPSLSSGAPAGMFSPRTPQVIIGASVAAGAAFQPAWAIGRRFVNQGIGI